MPLLSDDEVEERLGSLQGWSREGDSLRKEFDRGDFKGAVAFLNAITPVAEEMNHHPDVSISWKTVTLSLSTHSEGGITQNDFELARRIDSLA